MKVSKCCKATLYVAERMSEDNYPYGEIREVLCCSNCGTEKPIIIVVE